MVDLIQMREAFGPLVLSQLGILLFFVFAALVGFVIYSGLGKIFSGRSCTPEPPPKRSLETRRR